MVDNLMSLRMCGAVVVICGNEDIKVVLYVMPDASHQ